jgi:hypothetical protein
LQGDRTDLAGTSQGEESATNLDKIAADSESDAIESETARRGSVVAMNGRSHTGIASSTGAPVFPFSR